MDLVLRADGDGVCDDVDDCLGTLDACGVVTVLALFTTVVVQTSHLTIVTVMEIL